MDGAHGDLHHIRPWRRIERRRSRKIRVGKVEVGGDAPITVQSMTNTPTADAAATIDQIRRLEEAGADIVRVSCPDEDSTAAFAKITREANVPLVADIHFHYRRAIEAAAAGAACLRINPGNIGGASRVKEVVQAALSAGRRAVGRALEPLARFVLPVVAALSRRRGEG
jgi:(E)-4-hydroxy-3-methylbut-2-enyl-diphosphate synthase